MRKFFDGENGMKKENHVLSVDHLTVIDCIGAARANELVKKSSKLYTSGEKENVWLSHN